MLHTPETKQTKGRMSVTTICPSHKDSAKTRAGMAVGAWRDGSAGKGAVSSRRGYGVSSQHSHGGSQLFVIPVSWDPISFSDLRGHQACMKYTYIHILMQNTYTSKIKTSKQTNKTKGLPQLVNPFITTLII